MATELNDRVRIEPVELGVPSTARGSGRGPRPNWLGLLAAAVCLGLVGGGVFFLTLKPVILELDPPADTVAWNGEGFTVQLGGRHLARPGVYEVRAEKVGYEDLVESVEVTGDGDNRFRFALVKLPGRVTVEAFGRTEGEPPLPEITVTVDERPVASSGIELAAGAHRFAVVAPRYQAAVTNLTVEGMGKEQTLRIGLLPGWATLRVGALVDGAEVWIDDARKGDAPRTIELDPGRYRVEVRAEGYQAFATQVVAQANQEIVLDGIALLEANAQLMVRSTPAGALVSLDGAYQGAAPLEIPMAPGVDHEVRLAKAGFEDEVRSVSGRPEERVELSVALTPMNGVIRFEVEPADAHLTVDGKGWGVVPEQIELSAMEHTIEIGKEGFAPHRQTLRPKPDIPQVVKITLTPTAPMAPEASASSPSGAGEGAAPVQREVTSSTGYTLVRIEPGSFRMGASRREQGRRSNETLVNVELLRPFLMGTKEVTNREFRQFAASHDSGRIRNVLFNRDEQPVVNVAWTDAARYCNWLSEKDGLPAVYRIEGDEVSVNDPVPPGYRLPTEAEWAYSARKAGQEELQKYPWGSGYPPKKASGNYADDTAAPLLARVMRGYEDGHVAGAPPGSFAPNAAGLYDLGGNVAEWCHDRYGITAYEPDFTQIDPVGPKDGPYHVIRGSSWKQAGISELRLSYREYGDEGRNDVGFRVCRYADAGGAP